MAVHLENASVRAALGMSRSDVAREARVDRRTIMMFEVGEQFVSDAKRIHLRRYYALLRRQLDERRAFE